MSDRAAASAGFTLAGLGLAAAVAGLLPGSFLGWPTTWAAVATGAGLLTVGAFGARRYGYARRPAGSIAAGAAAGLLVAGAGAGLLAAPVGQRAGPAATIALGVGAIAAANADRLGIGRERLGETVAATVTAAAVGVSGLLAIVVWGFVIAVFVRGIGGGGVDAETATALSTLALGLGTASVAAAYLGARGLGLGYLDVRRPTLVDLGYVVAGAVALVALNLGIGAVFEAVGLESAPHSIIETARGSPGILLVLIPLSYLVIGPGEELLYRNVVQKSLYGVYSRPAAIVVASGIFAGVHFFAFSSGPGLLATLNTLLVVFALSLVLGVVYERTGSVVVPALVHGTFDAIAFAVTYAQITGAFDGAAFTWGSFG